MIHKFLNPAIYLMNKLTFKFKIITVISMLFILLIMPSRTVFIDYIQKDALYDKQQIGLNYIAQLQPIIQEIQLHRGLSNAYLSGKKEYKTPILKSEKKVIDNLDKLINYDKKHLNLLKHQKEFVYGVSRFAIIRFNNINKSTKSKKVFHQHTTIIAQFIKTVKNIAIKTSFSTSNDLKINYLSNMLEEKLLLLQENTGLIRGHGVEFFAKQKISTEQKSKLLEIFTITKALEENLLDNNVLTNMENYLSIQTTTAFVSHKLDTMLDIVNQNIFMTDIPNYDEKLFFTYATTAINEQTKLYRVLLKSYESLIKQKRSTMLSHFVFTLLGFLLIIVAALYLSSAFYSSIATSLKKLQTASRMIAAGKTKIHLSTNTDDELGKALLAFNDMSQKLDANISFLDGYKMAIDETSIVSKTDTKGIITYVNKKFCELSGYNKNELIGRSHNIVRHPDVPKEVFKELWGTIKQKKVWKGIVKNSTKDGGFYIVDATILPVLDSNGDVIEYIGVRHDITELEKSKLEIQKQKIDLLTKLPNRSQLLDDLKVAKKPILFYLNIDDFENLNDFYGEEMGDKVLIQLAHLLSNISQNVHSKLYKLHADEFILYFEEGQLTTENYKKALLEIINYVEKETINCDTKSCVSITLSAGVSFYNKTEDYETLLTYASKARKIAKTENKKFMLYSSNMNKDFDYENNIEWINKIKDAIKEGRITTFFQPIIDNRTGAITKYESLVRLVEKDGKIISPFFFLDIAKKAKLYTKITKIVVNNTLETFKKLPQYEFSMNITVEDIYDEEISSYIFEQLADFPHPQKVILEITESEEIKDYEKVNTFIERIKNIGAKIAIDDFGSGYSNFEHIIKLNADFIKIDGSLIKNIDNDDQSRIITEAIIAFSKKLGSKTIVEFVHNETVYEKVKELGADYSQGFYLGEPQQKLVDIKSIIEHAQDAPQENHSKTTIGD